MKWVVAFFVFVCSTSFAEEAPRKSDDLNVILEKTFLSSQSEPFLNILAMEAIAESQKKIDAQELIAKFRENFLEEATLAKFYEPYQTEFSDAEIKELRKIHENPVWEKYSKQGMQIFQANMQRMKDLFKDLALNTKAEEAQVIAANTDIVDVTKDNVEETINSSTLPTIVDVNATWCNPCRMMEPIFEELSEEYKGKIQFAKIDHDSQPELVKKFGVSSLPTILFFKAGQKTPAMKSVGLISKSDFEAKIDQLLKK